MIIFSHFFVCLSLILMFLLFHSLLAYGIWTNWNEWSQCESDSRSRYRMCYSLGKIVEVETENSTCKTGKFQFYHVAGNLI